MKRPKELGKQVLNVCSHAAECAAYILASPPNVGGEGER